MYLFEGWDEDGGVATMMVRIRIFIFGDGWCQRVRLRSCRTERDSRTAVSIGVLIFVGFRPTGGGWAK